MECYKFVKARHQKGDREIEQVRQAVSLNDSNEQQLLLR